MKRCIVTYASGAHEELLDVALPTYKEFAHRWQYELIVGRNHWLSMKDMPAPWMKIPLLLKALHEGYNEVVWFDCDLVVVDFSQDFPPLEDGKLHAMVRHFEDNSEVPNSGVWRLRGGRGEDSVEVLLNQMRELEVFKNHGWWEQAALLTLMGYTVPPEGSHFPDTKCRCVHQTKWHKACQFMRLKFNSHPQYRAENPVIVHCSYPSMPERLEVMRALVKDPCYHYPQFSKPKERDERDKEGWD